MKILALDSSGLVASVAVMEDDNLIAEYTMNHKKTHSQTLVPMMDEVRSMVELDLSTIDAIAVAAGPGSFTGLRIGSTVDALAFNLYASGSVICPLMDARRNQVYTGLYEFVKNATDFDMHCILEQCTADIAEIVDKVNALGKDVIFLGDGVAVYKTAIEERITVPYSYAPASCNRQRAACVAALGQRLYQKGIVQTAEEHTPEYLRLSQAERERTEAANGHS